MKKLRYLVLMLFVTALLTGCSEKEKQEAFFAEKEQITEEKIQNQKENVREKKPAAMTEHIVDYAAYFCGINGCAVLYDESANSVFFYNKEQCEKEVSPLSTFKIVSTLAGLEYGILEDEKTTMEYSGAKYPVDAWNAELTLQEAFQTSCVWYFRQVVDDVGQENMLSLLNKLQYGNCDITKWQGEAVNPLSELNGFWLDSSLKISPLQQVQVLNGIFSSENRFHDKNIEILKEVMYVTELEDGALYGKTGTGTAKAWFAGFLEKNGKKIYLAVYLEDEQNGEDISGNKAREIATALLKDGR